MWITGLEDEATFAGKTCLGERRHGTREPEIASAAFAGAGLLRFWE